MVNYRPRWSRIKSSRSGGATCSAFTRVAACTLARSPYVVTAIRRLQTLRLLHACSGRFQLERSPGGACTHWKKRRLVTAHVESGPSRSEHFRPLTKANSLPYSGHSMRLRSAAQSSPHPDDPQEAFAPKCLYATHRSVQLGLTTYMFRRRWTIGPFRQSRRQRHHPRPSRRRAPCG